MRVVKCIRRMRWVVAAFGPPSIKLNTTVPTAAHARMIMPRQVRPSGWSQALSPGRYNPTALKRYTCH